MATQTESINTDLLDLELRNNNDILTLLLNSQQQAVEAVRAATPTLDKAVTEAAARLQQGEGRIVMVGAGASGRLAVQDGAELWPTYGWPHERLLLSIAGGESALLKSVEGTEDDANDAQQQVQRETINANDVVLGLAASGQSPWTVAWLKHARDAGALTIAMSNNDNTPLLDAAQVKIFLNSGAEVLAGSTRMSAGTSQKIALNLFSTLLMVRLNRTYGNLMVDMAAVNVKLQVRRQRMLKQVLPNLSDEQVDNALAKAGGWVKLAAVVAQGKSADEAKVLLEQFNGSLRETLQYLSA